MGSYAIDVPDCAAHCCDSGSSGSSGSSGTPPPCLECIDVPELFVTSPAGPSATLTQLPGGNEFNRVWNGFITDPNEPVFNQCEVTISCEIELGEAHYYAQVSGVLCTGEIVEITINSCDPLDLSFDNPPGCCAAGHWVVSA